MKRFRTTLAIAALAMTIVAVFYLDYPDLSWQANRSTYMAIISALSTSVNMICLNRYEAKKARLVG